MNVAGGDFTGNGSDAKHFGSDFHQLSQELRNPLNSISGFAELLLMDEALSSDHADYVRAILTGSEALTAAVVSMLDRAEERSPVVMAAPASQAFSEIQPEPRGSFLARASRWGSQRIQLSRGRPATL